MAVMDQIMIEGYRGIRNLHITDLNRINLIVGDNNCGKTSVLEAIQLFRISGDIGNMYRIAKQRDSLSVVSANSIYDSFVCLFPRTYGELKIKVNGIVHDKPIDFQLKGMQKRILLDAKELDRFARGAVEESSSDLETDAFEGELTLNYGDTVKSEPVMLNRFTKISGTAIFDSDEVVIVYVAPFEHLRGTIISRIIKNDGYKEICLRALQLFDPDIEDMMVFRSERGNRPVEYLKHRRLGNMPLATFGDGIKKVLVLANAIARTAGGILLIDEIETSIHKKYYDDIFQFIIKASRAFNVQLFITTHSLEAIDGILATQNYNDQDTEDIIRVITLRKESDKTYSRVMSGREVSNGREAFGFEVRL